MNTNENDDATQPLSTSSSDFFRRPHPADQRYFNPHHLRTNDIPIPTSFAKLRPSQLEWLWPGRIPIGKVTLLVGNPDVGKSLISLDIAARVSRGARWPDAVPNPLFEIRNPPSLTDPPLSTLNPQPSTPVPQPASVLLLSAEDDPADTIYPRLLAAGANCRLISTLPLLRESRTSTSGYEALNLRRDLAQVDYRLQSLHPCRLLVIDPISAYVDGRDENLNTRVRQIMAYLTDIATRHKLAVLAVCHLRKQAGAALYRAMGSLGWIAAARAAWLVARDPAAPNRRIMLPLKNNLASSDTGLAYTIESAPWPNNLAGDALHNEDIPQSDQPVIRWLPEPITTTPDELLRPKRPVGRPSEERDDAVRWLQKALAAGPRPSSKEIEEEASGYGISRITLRRAFRYLGGEATKVGYGPSQWHWSLPSKMI